MLKLTLTAALTALVATPAMARNIVIVGMSAADANRHVEAVDADSVTQTATPDT